MKIENKEDIANFIESHLKELGGESYGVNYIAERLFEWHESELKNLRLGVVGGSLPDKEDFEYACIEMAGIPSDCELNDPRIELAKNYMAGAELLVRMLKQ